MSNPQSANRYSYVLNNPIKYSDPTGHVAIGDTNEAGCSGKGPKCIIDMYSRAGDYEGGDDSLRHYVRRHPNYNPLEDDDLSDEDRAQVAIIMFQTDADDVAHIENFWDRTKASLDALFKNLAPVALTAIIVNGTESNNNDGSTSVIQYGDHTIKESSLKKLGLTKEDSEAVHIALKEIRESHGLPNNFHGNIYSNGDYVNPQTGQVLGNILDYLP